ncbi:sugar phosphate isomerase/epimerase [Candidatus Peregrinibacteria bacterium]|nr:sugar phosphate isomerase/epimerase [Candidatus Peregrinibacteria bacterium]
MLAICSESFRGYGLNRIFEFIKKSGFDGLDLTIDPKNFDSQDPSYIKELVDKYQIPVLAISTPITGSAKKIESAVDMAKTLGTKVIVIQPPRIFDFKYASWLKNEIPKIRQKENISIALENAPSETFLGIIPEHSMANVVDLKKFKHVCIDTTRVATRKDDLIRTYKALKPYLVHVHLSNVKNGVPYSTPESGILPIESFLTKLKQDGFPGTISIKINSKFLALGEDAKILKELKALKDFYDTYFTNIKTVKASTSE